MDILGNHSIMMMFYSLMIKIFENWKFLHGNFLRKWSGELTYKNKLNRILWFHRHRSNQIRFRIRFDDEQLFIGISELYIGSNCINACYGHGMCSSTGRCRYFPPRSSNDSIKQFLFRCDPGWVNNDCGLSLIQFPNEIDILKQNHYTSYGVIENKKCGKVFNNVRIIEW